MPFHFITTNRYFVFDQEDLIRSDKMMAVTCGPWISVWAGHIDPRWPFKMADDYKHITIWGDSIALVRGNDIRVV